MKRRLLIGTLAILCGLSLIAGYFLGSDDDKRGFSLSRETTYVTGPLTADGYVDYVAAVNEQTRNGVTPKNNGAVPYLRVVGPAAIDEAVRKAILAELGLDDLADVGEYFTPFPARNGSFLNGSFLAAGLPRDVTERLWRASDYPQFFRWLAANQKPLDAIREAVKRPRWYVPTVVDPSLSGPALLQAESPWRAGYDPRDIADAFVARAMLNAGQGRTQEAWLDLLAVHRLARLIGQQPTTVEALVGLSIDSKAVKADAALVESGQLTVQEARTVLAELERLPPPRSVVGKLPTERLVFLDSIQWLARETRREGNDLDEPDPTGLRARIQEMARDLVVDWNGILRRGNAFFDQIEAITKKTDRRAARREFEGFAERVHEEYARVADELGKPTHAAKRLVTPTADGISQDISVILHEVFLPTVPFEADYRREVRVSLARVSFALAAYRAEHGRYPRTLSALTPKYLDPLPTDPLTGNGLGYFLSRTGFGLYSIGPNGRDEGGRIGMEEDDVGVGSALATHR